MAALPVKKQSKARQGRRQVAYKLKPIHFSICPQCRSAKLPHSVCLNCGTYKGRQVGTSNG